MKIYKNITWIPLTCFIINRRTPNIIKMNDIWFKDNIQYSPPDQVSFQPYCIKADVDLQLLYDTGGTGMVTLCFKKTHSILYAQYN